MKIKTIVIFLLTLCVGSFSTLPLYAQAPTEGSVGIEVSTDVINYPDFAISIPTVIPIGEIQKTADRSIKSTAFSIKVTDLETLDAQRVDVTLISPDEEFYLYNGVYRIPYEIYNQETGGDAMRSGDIFASFTQNGEVKGRVEVDQAQIPAEGSYGASVQFVVEVVQADPEQQ